MSYTLSQQIAPKQKQSLKQTQRMMISPHMQQAIHLLQLPVMELSQYVSEELSQNPVLEVSPEEETDEDFELDEAEDAEKEEKSLSFNDNDLEILKRLDEDFRDLFSQTEAEYTPRTHTDDKFQTYQESLITSPLSLQDFLTQQAHDQFSDPNDFTIAEEIIGSLDEKGFFESAFDELAKVKHVHPRKIEEIFTLIQTFDPPGVAARNLQECLLLQLERQSKKESLAYAVVQHAFQELLHNKLPVILKKMQCTKEALQEALDKDIRPLDLHPGLNYSTKPIPFMIPDVTIRAEGDDLSVIMHEDSQPALRLNSSYLRMLDQEGISAEEKEYIRDKVGSAKWLIRNLFERNNTLERIVQTLIVRQKAFFSDANGQLSSLTMKVLAEELELHESTIARAVSNKYIDTPRGIFPLRYFFRNAFITDKGQDLSSNAVRDVLLDILQKEDKKHPLTDQSLSNLLLSKGIPCARRTVAKYRLECNVGNAQQRKKF